MCFSARSLKAGVTLAGLRRSAGWSAVGPEWTNHGAKKHDGTREDVEAAGRSGSRSVRRDPERTRAPELRARVDCERKLHVGGGAGSHRERVHEQVRRGVSRAAVLRRL